MWPFHPRRSQRRARTSSRSSAKENPFPSRIGPISWWVLSHSEENLGTSVRLHFIDFIVFGVVPG